MMSLNWTNCGLLWGARAMPNGFGSLFADAPVKSSPMPLGLGLSYAIGPRDYDEVFPHRCRELYERLPRAYKRCATYSDFWSTYDEVFPHNRSVGKETGETAHVERWNNTLRQRLGRFTRKTLSFSKLKSMHETCLRLFIHQYNQELATIPT